MKVLILLTPLLSCLVNAQEEASLMQGLLARQKQLTSDTGDYVNHRKDGNSKLLDTATQMLKSGATSEFLVIAERLRDSINTMIVAINHEHDVDQTYLDQVRDEFAESSQAMSDCLVVLNTGIAGLADNSILHKKCRQQESVLCAASRWCEAELETLALTVQEETKKVNDKWFDLAKHRCPDYLDALLSLSCPFDFTDPARKEGPETGQTVHAFPTLGPFASDFRITSHQMLNAIDTAARDDAIAAYEAKLGQCKALEEPLENQTAQCDTEQDNLRKLGCGVHHAECRLTFFDAYTGTLDNYNLVKDLYKQHELDRMNETITLTVAECLINSTYDHVKESITTGTPCISEESDPENITIAIENCHRMNLTWVTGHLHLDYPEVPHKPNLPDVTLPCSDEWNREHVGLFHDFDAWQTDLRTQVDVDDPLSLVLASGDTEGWGGCAAPKVCLGCTDGDGTNGDGTNSPSGLPAVRYSEIPGKPPSCTVYSYDGREASIVSGWKGSKVFNDREYTFDSWAILNEDHYDFIQTSNGASNDDYPLGGFPNEGKYERMDHLALNITCDEPFSVFVQFVGFEHNDTLKTCTRHFDHRHGYRCSKYAFNVETNGKHMTRHKLWALNMHETYQIEQSKEAWNDDQWPKYMPPLSSFQGEHQWHPEFQFTRNEYHSDVTEPCTGFDRVFDQTALIPGNGCHDGSYLVFISGVGE